MGREGQQPGWREPGLRATSLYEEVDPGPPCRPQTENPAQYRMEVGVLGLGLKLATQKQMTVRQSLPPSKPSVNWV